MAAKNISGKISNNQVEKIEDLIYDLHPAIYINDSKIKTFGEEPPVIAEVSSTNNRILKSPNPLFNSVELLKIKLGEEDQYNSNVDLAQLKAFDNLKYVFVECSFNCGKSKIEGMFSNVGDITIIYLIATQE